MPTEIEEFNSLLVAPAFAGYMEQITNQMFDANPDRDDALSKYATSQVIQAFGFSEKFANDLAQTGVQTALAKRENTVRKSFGKSMLTSFENWGKGTSGGLVYATGYLMGDEEQMQRGAKILASQTEIWEDYGFFGDLAIMGLPVMADILTYLAIGAMTSGTATPALAAASKAVTTAGKLGKVGAYTAKGLGFLSKNAPRINHMLYSGFTQMGSLYGEMSLWRDENGNKLDLESTEAKLLFFGGALAMGGVEQLGLDFSPSVKYLNDTFGKKILGKAWKEGGISALSKQIGKIGVGSIKSHVLTTAGEATEELMQSFIGDFTTNLVIGASNKKGSNFDPITGEEVTRNMVTSFVDGMKAMFFPTLITGGVGKGMNLASRRRASNTFNQTATSGTVDIRNMKVSPDVSADYMTVAQERGAFDPEVKQEPIAVIQDENGIFTPVGKEEANRLLDIAMQGKRDIEIELTELSPDVEISEYFADKLGGAITEDGTIVVSPENLDSAIETLQAYTTYRSSLETDSDGVKEFAIYNPITEKIVKVSMSTDTSLATRVPEVIENPAYTRINALTMTHAEYLQSSENRYIAERIGNLVQHTNGNITPKQMVANIEATKATAKGLGITVDKLLADHVTVVLKDDIIIKRVDGIAEGLANGAFRPGNIKDGIQGGTIVLSKIANGTTLIHELGHLLEANLSESDKVAFEKRYGIKDGQWVVRDKDGNAEIDYREQFADDFVRYLSEGKAPTAELEGAFAKFKQALHKLLRHISEYLNPEVRDEFARLLGDDSLRGKIKSDTKVSKKGEVLYQKAEGYDQYIDDAFDGEEVRLFNPVTRGLPLVFKEIGVSEKSIVFSYPKWARNHIDESGDLIHPEADREVFKALPAQLSDPIAIFDSASLNIPDSLNALTVFTDIPVGDNLIMVAIHLDKREGRIHEVHRIASAYERSNTLETIQSWIDGGYTRYLDEKRTSELFGSPEGENLQIDGLQLPNWNSITNSSGHRVVLKSELVKKYPRAFGELGITEDPDVLYQKSIEDTEAFKNWSNGNPVVSPENAKNYHFKAGEPVTVQGYHGTPNEFYEFDINKLGKNGRLYGSGFYFTEDYELAHMFTGQKMVA